MNLVYRVLPLARADLVHFRIRHKETDLCIQCSAPFEREAESLVIEARLAIEEYIRRVPEFLHARSPMVLDEFAPEIVREMMEAAEIAGVGPMASVAGAIAQYVARGLLNRGAKEVVCENGGDCYVDCRSACTVGIWAGTSPFSGKIGLTIQPHSGIHGVCTSSGSIGHSLSLGSADAVTIVAESAAIADAVATRIGNIVRGPATMERALAHIEAIEHVRGGVVIVGERMGVVGQVELAPVSANGTLT